MEQITIPRRFWLFRYDIDSKYGGMDDKEPGSFGSIDEAIAALAPRRDCAEVAAVNRSTGELETVAWYDGGVWIRGTT